MNRYKFTPSINLSTRLTKKLAVNRTNFLNMLNSGLTSNLVAVRSGVSTRTVQRLRRDLVQQIVDNTNFSNWDYAK